MEKIKVVIVDDSHIFITLLQDIFEENGFEVVGSAGSPEEVRKVLTETKPDLVTMDISMPGTDGFECTRIAREIDENIKVIIVSAMMDEEIVEEAKAGGVSAVVQKPVDPEEMVATARRVMAQDGRDVFLRAEYAAVFKEALKDSLTKMAKSNPKYAEENSGTDGYVSVGIDVLVGIVGKVSGRMLLGLSKEAAKNLTQAILNRESENFSEMTGTLSEFANIVAGNACSLLNRKDKSAGLRVTPPAVLIGKNIEISPPGFTTNTAVAYTEMGTFYLNVGFKKGEATWM